jgi:hypothetical protein
MLRICYGYLGLVMDISIQRDIYRQTAILRYILFILELNQF